MNHENMFLFQIKIDPEKRGSKIQFNLARTS